MSDIMNNNVTEGTEAPKKNAPKSPESKPKSKPKKAPKEDPNEEEQVQSGGMILQIDLSQLIGVDPDNEYIQGNMSMEEYENAAVDDLMVSITDWLESTPFPVFRDAIRESVIGQENIDIVLANVYNYLCNIVGKKKINNNMLMAAPSGCGKTETYRALKEYFKEWIPDLVISQVDVSVITEEGIVGGSSSLLVQDLMMSDTGGYGIVFMDEFDKKLIPSFAEGSNTSAAVQNQLLTIIEGREVQEIFEGQATGYSIDTSKTMFIGLGSFNDSRERKKKQAKNGLGFGAVNEEHDYFEDITREDMIKMGACYEMIGRFPLIVNYHKLDTRAIDLIIDKTVKNLQESYRLPILLSQEMRDHLHKLSNGVYGCRLIDSTIRDQVIKRYTEWLMDPSKYKSPLIVIQNESESYLAEQEE